MKLASLTLGLSTLVSTGSCSTAFKEIYSGRFFPGGFLSGGFYPFTTTDLFYDVKSKKFTVRVYVLAWKQQSGGSVATSFVLFQKLTLRELVSCHLPSRMEKVRAEKLPSVSVPNGIELATK